MYIYIYIYNLGKTNESVKLTKEYRFELNNIGKLACKEALDLCDNNNFDTCMCGCVKEVDQELCVDCKYSCGDWFEDSSYIDYNYGFSIVSIEVDSIDRIGEDLFRYTHECGNYDYLKGSV